jgi:hypothetical protein
MPAIDLSILNQRQTPAFYADTLANRPSAGFIGRIFVSTNTFEFYRDNGTTWDLIGGPGTSTVTGTGANGQVTYWNGTSSITGSNDLFFDAVNGHLGVGTVTPGTALDVKHDQSTVVQLEQITATNDIRIAFINNGVGLWRLGAFYNAGANDFGLFDIAASAQPVTVKRTTGQVLIGTSTVGSGKLVVASATGDNGVQIVGATAPSLRIDNAESGPTKRAGLGISTATNNFIQGSADRDFCMFNGSTTASPILFGIYDTTNVQEAARISSVRNLLVGKTVDSGENLQVGGTVLIGNTTTCNNFINVRGVSLNPSLRLTNTTATTGVDWHLYSLNNGNFGIFNQSTGNYAVTINNSLQVGINNSSPRNQLDLNSTGAPSLFDAGFNVVQNGGEIELKYISAGQAGGRTGAHIFYTGTAAGGTEALRITSSRNLLIGTTTDAGQKLQVSGDTKITGNIFTNRQTGNNYPQTSTSGTTSIVDTSIFFNTSVLGYGQSAIYQVTITGNPQDGGSNAYRNIIFGYISVKTGFTGSVVQEIQWNEIFNNTATAFTPFVITVFFWNGTTESLTIANGTTNAQIRVKVTGYGGTVGAGGQEVTIYKIN